MIATHIAAVLPKIIESRHALHNNPELRYEEHETAALVVRYLSECGYQNIQTGVGGTGVVAILDSGKPGKTVALRADMDALPITEQTNLPYQSKNPGKMHACGHDGHTATLLGVAYVLQQIKQQLTGKIKLIFQPAEEGGAGAAAMIKDGVLTNPNVDAIFGYHNWPTAKAGVVCVREQCQMAGGNLVEIVIHGKGGHGAMPHLTTDPIYIGAILITQLQSLVSRFNSPTEPVVISICKFEAGTTHNIIPETATLLGTVRSTSLQGREKVLSQLKAMVDDVTKTYGASATVTVHQGYPPTINHPAETEIVRKTAHELFGTEGLYALPNPVMVAEDFSFYLQEIPGCYFFIGNGEDAPMCHEAPF